MKMSQERFRIAPTKLYGLPDESKDVIYHHNLTAVLVKKAKYLPGSGKQKINQYSNMFKKQDIAYFLEEVKVYICPFHEGISIHISDLSIFFSLV